MRENLQELFQAMIAAVRIGDSLGLALETMNEHQIESVSQGGVTGFESIPPDLFKHHAFKSMHHLVLGDCSDDYDQTRGNALAYIYNRGVYNTPTMARELVKAFRRRCVGWGKTSVESTRELDLYLTTGTKGRDPKVRAAYRPPGGTGNAPMMKISPIAAVETVRTGGYDREWLSEIVMKHSLLTHGDVRAGHAAFAIACVISQALCNELFLDNIHLQRDFLKSLIHEVKSVESTWPAQVQNDLFSGRLDKLLENEYWRDPSMLARSCGTSSYSLESGVFCIGLFLRYAQDFRQGLLAAVNAGGDTDTNAAIVGSMIGANVGLEHIPHQWLYYRLDFYEPIVLGTLLWEVSEDMDRARIVG